MNDYGDEIQRPKSYYNEQKSLIWPLNDLLKSDFLKLLNQMI